MARLAGLPQFSEEEERSRTEARGRSEVVRRALRARILVIDDEPLFGQTMSMLLGGQHDVTVERSGYAALRRLLVDRDFDLVLCDLSLPDLDGPSLYEQVRRRDSELAGRFVFVTGGAFTDSNREFLKGYQGAHLEKPFAISEVERLFELRRLSA